MPAPAIQVLDVTKIYSGRTVLDAIRLDVMQGETLVILGGSGSGKSTLLRLMIGNVCCDGGDIVGLGRSLVGMTDAQMDAYRKSIGVLFQSGALFNSMSVADNVALPLREHTDLPEETIAIMVKIKLELVGLREHADKMPAQLSGGMKKRAGLARALALPTSPPAPAERPAHPTHSSRAPTMSASCAAGGIHTARFCSSFSLV